MRRSEHSVAPLYLDKYYVYALFKPDSYHPFYVGKGKGERINQHFRKSSLNKNTPKTGIIKKYGNSIKREILCYFDNELSAYEFEEYLIASYGLVSEGGSLVNYAKTRFEYSNKFVEDISSRGYLHREDKYSKDVVFKAYDLYFRQNKELYEIERTTGIPLNYLYYVLSGKKHKHLFQDYSALHSDIDLTYGRTVRKKRPEYQKVSDEDLMNAFDSACNGILVKSLAEKLNVNSSWLSSVFVGTDRPYLDLDYSKYRNVRKGRGNSKEENMRLVKTLIDKGLSTQEIITATGFGRTTVFRYIKEIKLENAA